MKTTYLNEYNKFVKQKVAYVSIGTLEWHGSHLPIETDFLIAQKICEIAAKKIPGYILPPIFLGSGTKKKINGRWLIGMDKFLRKKLPGNLYYLEPDFFSKVLVNLNKNLMDQGFKKIFIITGHAGNGQIKALALVKKKLKNLIIVNPYENLSIDLHHADEYETSLLWACYPEEEKKSKKIKIGKNDDFFRYIGYDPRKKSSIRIGKKILAEMIKNINPPLSPFVKGGR